VRRIKTLTRLLLPKYSFDEGEVVSLLQKVSHLHLGCLCYALKLLVYGEGQSPWTLFGAIMQGATIMALLYTRLCSYESAYIEHKLLASFALLLGGELLDAHPSSKT